jgi:sterol desaturase/sphingolipid hydroxylase (fatty acid hydroxylase superfamily)
MIRSWSIPAQLFFFLLTHDFYIYWFHRLQHNSKVLWRTHEAHHSVRDVDWLAGSRSHALEILINQSIEFIPMVLLGSPEVAIIKGMIDAIWGMYIHSNIDVRSGKLQYIINGPEMHRWHHADEVEAYNHNYSTKFAIWDWIFRTDFFPRNRKATRYGLSDVDFPKNYFKQQAFLFRRLGRK